MGLQILSEPIFILYLDSVSRWDWFSIAFYPQSLSSIVIFTFSINELPNSYEELWMYQPQHNTKEKIKIIIPESIIYKVFPQKCCITA